MQNLIRKWIRHIVELVLPRRYSKFLVLLVARDEKNPHRIHARIRLRSTVYDLRDTMLLKRRWLNAPPRQPKLIVSLTSIPPRLYQVDLAIKSIMRQTEPPDKIILWLSNEHKRSNLGNLSPSQIPARLSKLQKGGLDIRWTEDIGSYRKLLPALQEFPDDIIVTIDDDIYHRKNLLETLYAAYQRNKRHIYCTRSRIIKRHEEADGSVSYSADELYSENSDTKSKLFVTGGAGTLYPPGIFDEEIFNQNKFLELVPYEDDCWFNVMAMRREIQIKQVDFSDITSMSSTYEASLSSITQKSKTREHFNKQFTTLMNHYRIEL